jgi:regulator of sigma E protease
MDFLIKAAQLIMSLSILVVLHELGHFLPARWFKTRVEKFYLFFDWKFALWKKRLGETEFGIGWIPLGGYVKIAGMIDESLDTEQLKRPPQPWEFRSKPPWQRLIIMVGGVTVNLLLGMVIYIGVLWTWGLEYLPTANVTWGVHPSATLKEQGLQDGDRLLAVDGEEPKDLRAAGRAILIDGARRITVERDGQRIDITLSADVNETIMDRDERVLFSPRLPFVVDSIVAGGPAEASGAFRKGDRIVALDGEPAAFFEDFLHALEGRRQDSVTVTLERDGERIDVPLVTDADGKVGLGPRRPEMVFTLVRERFGFFAAIPAGIRYGIETLGSYVRSMKLLFSKAGAKQVGGFGTLGGLFGEWGDWQRFWEMTAFLSIILAFMNILPIPALDGGHVVFLLYEMVTGRTPNQRVLEVAQMIGIVLLIGLLLFANANDVFKFLTGRS